MTDKQGAKVPVLLLLRSTLTTPIIFNTVKKKKQPNKMKMQNKCSVYTILELAKSIDIKQSTFF